MTTANKSVVVFYDSVQHNVTRGLSEKKEVYKLPATVCYSSKFALPYLLR